MPWYAVVGAVFLGWATLGALLGGNPSASFFGAGVRYEGVLGFFAYLVVFLAARHVGGLRFLPSRTVFVAGSVVLSLVALLALMQQVWPEGSPLMSLSLMSLERSVATFGNPIYYGLLAGLVLPIVVAVLSLGRASLEAYVVTTCATTMAAAYFTYSRAFWLAAVCGLALTIALLTRMHRLRWRSLLVAAVVAVALIVVVGIARPGDQSRTSAGTLTGRVTETVEGGGTVRTRLQMYGGALRMIGERPVVGWGFETYMAQGARLRTEYMVRLESPAAYPDRPHDSLLYIGYATGIPGLLLYLAFLGGAGWAAVRGVRRRRGAEKVFAVGLLGGVAAYVVGELTLFSTIEVAPFFWAALGWATAVPASVAEGDPELPVAAGDEPDVGGGGPLTGYGESVGVWLPGGMPRMAAGILVVVLAVGWLLAGVWRSVEIARADHAHLTVVTGTHDIADYEALVAAELQAARRDPSAPQYWNNAAAILEKAAAQYRRLELLDDARDALMTGLEHIPQDPTLIVTLSNVELQAGRPQQAIDLLEPYLLLDRYQTDAHFNVALAYLTLAQPEKAAAHLETVVDLVPADGEAHAYLSVAYERLGRAADAQRVHQQAIAIDPKWRDLPTAE